MALQTKLDERFSDADTTATSWDDALRVIEQAQLFWISTVRRDGRPHVTPLVAVWLDDALHFSSGPDEQKGVNLRDNAYVALTTGCNGWQDGLDVVVEGEAKLVFDEPTLTRLAQAWTRKWDGRWTFTVGDGGFDQGEHGISLVYAVRPARVLAFGKEPFTHTSHRF